MKMLVRSGATDYAVEIVDLHARPVIVLVEGERFEIWPETQSALAPQTHASTAPALPASALVVYAPLPGVVASVAVQAGAEVARGDILCVLEAMKMNNPIRAPRAGRIASVQVTPGTQVGHHQALLEYAPEATAA